MDFLDLVKFCEDYGTLLLCLDELVDLSSPAGRAMLKILLALAELERDQTAVRTRDHMQDRAIKGLHNGGRIWGYDLDPAKKGYLSVNPEQAAEIKMMFEKYLELGSTDAVLKYLHSNGIVCPRYESRRGNIKGGNPIHKQTLINILRNPRYIGKVPHKDQLFEGQHEPIIPEELYAEVQRRLDNYAQVRGPRKTRSEKPSHIYLLRGLIRCGQCESMMTPKPGKGYPYYVCTRVTNSAATRCKTPHLPAVAIEDHVVDRMRQLAIDPEEVKRLLADAAGREGADLQKKRLQVKKLAKLIAEKKKEMAPWQQKILSAGPEALEQPWYGPVQNLHDEIKQHTEEHNRALAELKDLEERQTSEEIVLEAYRRLGDLINTENREAMAKILPLVIETLVWTPTPDPDKPEKYIGGTYKMALFDNPLFPKDKDGNVLAVDDLSSSQGQDWLPLLDELREEFRVCVDLGFKVPRLTAPLQSYP